VKEWVDFYNTVSKIYDHVLELGGVGFIGEILDENLQQGGLLIDFQSGMEKIKWKVVRSRGGGVSLVVGEDLCVDGILFLSGKTLVGKFIGNMIGMEQLCRWVNEVWNPILENGTTYHI